MYPIIRNIARFLAIAGGVTLTALALLTTISIIGGSIAKIGNSAWLMGVSPSFATFLQNSGIRTIPGNYEIVSMGIAFCIFAFLPITQLERGHAVVDVFTNFLPERPNQFLITFWEVVFLIVLLVITWRLFLGLDRLMGNGQVYQDLQIPVWYGYAVAFLQLILTSIIAAYTAWAQLYKLFTGRDLLPASEGAVH